MKIFIITLSLFSLLIADEMQRIENIVNDIAKLRVDYEECQKGLKLKDNAVPSFNAQQCDCSKIKNSLQVEIDKEKQRGITLKQEIQNLKGSLKQNDELKQRIIFQRDIIEEKNNQINDLELQIANLQDTLALEQKKNSSKMKKVVCEKPEEKNVFPKLMMKQEQKATIEELVKEVKAATYRLNKPAIIFDTIEGEEVDVWDFDTSFTSNKQSQNWIKVTGYFVDQKWLPAKKSLWIKKEDVTKR